MSRPVEPKGDVWVLTRAKALLWRRAEVLADFEADTIREAHARVARGGAMSAAERQVVEDATAAMLAAGTQDLTNAGLAA